MKDQKEFKESIGKEGARCIGGKRIGFIMVGGSREPEAKFRAVPCHMAAIVSCDLKHLKCN